MFGQKQPDVFQRSEAKQVVVPAALEFHVFFGGGAVSFRLSLESVRATCSVFAALHGRMLAAHGMFWR
jgi:hypothetical protein